MVKRKISTPKKLTTPKKKPSTAKNCQIGKKFFYVPATTIRDIQKLQGTTTKCIPKLPFSRLIREILMEHTKVHMKVERAALEALQEAAEIYLTQLFEDSNLCANHAKRITLKPGDMKLALIVRGITDPGYSSHN